MSGQQSGLPCISCDSSDALTVYPKGDAYCFSCETYFHADQVKVLDHWTDGIREPLSASLSNDKLTPTLPQGKAENVPSRGLQEASLAYYGVTVRFDGSNGEPEYLEYPVYTKGEITGVKSENLKLKRFSCRGNTKSPELFGQAQCGGGKLIIITEGEKDCLSAWQMLRAAGKEYNVVSLPNGANTRSIRKNLEWLETFETVTLCFDMDEVGKKCAKETADILSPGKCKIMTLPVKDANEYMMDKTTTPKQFLMAVWNAKVYQPDGIVNLADAWDMMWEDENVMSIPYPWAGLNHKTYGQRGGEIVTWAAGTGTGKSAVVRELEHHLLQATEDNIGILALEETVGRTMWGLVQVEMSTPVSIKEERKAGQEEEVRKAFESTMGSGRVTVVNAKKEEVNSADALLNKVRYLIKGMQCKWIVLDHLAIVVSALDSAVDERRSIDIIMTRLVRLAVETGAGIHVVCHLRRIEGNRSHEQGVEVGLSHLRGSQAIAQLSDIVIGLERNQQADEEKEANLTRVRVLKNRYAGFTGLATNLAYDRSTGRLIEVKNVEEYLALSEEEAGC